jgi:enhancing lycopene biosynthesis protein 2
VSEIGLYLSGAGSLDGSDVFSAVVVYELLQEFGFTPRPMARDIPQGRVINHRFAHEQSDERNSLTESARVVRGDIDDLRDVDTNDLSGGVLVGGGGVLTTWTDYHERGRDCRITERLKFHLVEFFQQDKPVLVLDNAAVAVAVAFREQDYGPSLNPGDNAELRQLVEDTGSTASDRSPCVDESFPVRSEPDLTGISKLSELRDTLEESVRWLEELVNDAGV